MDSVVTYNATITYIDGTTDTISVVIVQDEFGRMFLTPWYAGHANNVPLGA